MHYFLANYAPKIPNYAQIMRIVHYFFSEKLHAFCNKAVAICSAPSCDICGRQGKCKKNKATKFYEEVANLATGAVEKADCSSTGFSPI